MTRLDKTANSRRTPAQRWRWLPITLGALACGCGGMTTDEGGPAEPAAAAPTEAEQGEAEQSQALIGDPIGEALRRARREFAGAHGEALPAFAAKCDLATGVHVPNFDCSAGTDVPLSNFSGDEYPAGTCDRPNRLSGRCDPGSRFQVLARTNDAVVVAHCRKKGLPGNLYGDIAVIQYNQASGAACFYQAFDDAGMDGNFKAPSLGTSLAVEADAPNPSAAPWLSNATTHGIDCRKCHDDGPIIRSPYLAQLASGKDALPGAIDNAYNKTNPVSFIGDDYQDWHLYSVQVSGSLCNSCHRLGVSNTLAANAGTALDFGIRATSSTLEQSKNANSDDSPIWMIPGQVQFNSGSFAAAQQIKSCGTAIHNGSALPAGCSKSEITIPFKGLSPANVSVLL